MPCRLLHHRKLGAVGAALLSKATTCCLIADGLHLDKATCALIFALKGAAKTILVTDRASIGTSGGDLVGLINKSRPSCAEYG